ncbi:hypothetical protein SAMN02745118_00859 [Selenihalanaerobacter shriftii]|uniref:Uncharacterized protein n=1 Tax=Selenihalanaerobacter shriftii TaxID=142842 RepID=A0A1T4KPB5_9FIRM|nr:hypothetical protein SAMN02745118_00859 [Selenihalanaerobacter shriftii]
MLRLEINQRFAQIGLRERKPRMNLQQKDADFKLKQVPGDLKISSKPAKVEIDQTKALADLNYQTPKNYSKKIARKGQQAVLRGIAQYTQEGDQLAAIEKGGKPLIRQAKQRIYEKKRELGLKWKRGPEIKINPSKQNINFKVNELDGIEVNSKPNFPKVNLQWGKVEVYQKQSSNLEIRAVDLRV